MLTTHSRRNFLQHASGLAAAPALLGLPRKAASNRPNFLFILTDDQRWDSLSMMGHPCLKTANMDRIGREGVHFANAFVTTSLCSPSRACFMTGQYAHRHGIRNNSTKLPLDTVTFATLLQRAGYDTAQIGKWHMGSMVERPGYSHSVTFLGQGAYNDPLLLLNGKEQKVRGYVTDLLTDYAVEWLSQKRSGPFCMHFGHKACHLPVIPAERHKNAFPDAKLPVPASAKDTLEGKPEWVRKRAEGKTGVVNHPDYDLNHRNYLRTLLAVDESIGKVLAELERQGTLDSTVIVFAGDNGFFHGEHGLTNKRAMYEESLRIPLLMRYPALVRPGTVTSEMALNIDMAPTFLDLAGLPIPAAVQGKSWVPLLSGREKKLRTSFLYEYSIEAGFTDTPSMEGIRTDRWKYIRYPEIHETDELYDLKADPHEMSNVVNDPAAAGQLKEIKAEFEQLKRSI